MFDLLFVGYKTASPMQYLLVNKNGTFVIMEMLHCYQRRLHGPASTRGTLGEGYGIAFDDARRLQGWFCISIPCFIVYTPGCVCLTGGFMNVTVQL